MDTSRFMVVGKVLKAHGLKGELCVQHYTDSPLLFHDFQKVYLSFPGRKAKSYPVANVRFNREKPLLLLHGIQGRDQAQDCRQAEIWIRRKDLPGYDPDVVLIEDLTGLMVYGSDECFLGTIRAIHNYKGQEIWVIVHPLGAEILFPAVDQFVLELNVQEGFATIAPPPGLLELYTSL